MVAVLPQLWGQLMKVVLAVEGSQGWKGRDCLRVLADALRQNPRPMLLQLRRDQKQTSMVCMEETVVLTVLLAAWLQVKVEEVVVMALQDCSQHLVALHLL